jgi:8-oxo-dGTP pyrophosphatase MutT (NUDIX family)
MSSIHRKVFAYITHAERLLVFRHLDFPEAGIQVPAGTVKEGEDLAEAVMREAQEETGLTDLVLVSYLGEYIRDMADVGRDEVQHRHFYHLRCEAVPPVRWQHAETDPSDGSPAPIWLELFWVDYLDRNPQLSWDHGFMLPLLEKRSLKVL